MFIVKPVESCNSSNRDKEEERIPPPPLIYSSNSALDEVSPPPSVRSRAFSQYSSTGEEQRRLLEILPSKPRSYSTSRDCFQTYYTPPQYEPLTKQRSYSFDAVGRSHKYFNDDGGITRPYPALSYTPPQQRKCSVDEGIGTSEGGSSDSLEISPSVVPNKRKV